MENRIPSAIITADMHLRDTVPKCRTDDYWAAQSRAVRSIRDLQEKYKVPILDGGDMLDTWKSSPYLEAWAIDNLPDGIITIPGNHELPYHNVDRLDRSSLNVLGKAGKIEILIFPNTIKDTKYKIVIYGFPFDTKSEILSQASKMTQCTLRGDDYIDEKDYRNIALCHVLVYEKENLWPGLEAIGANALLRKLKGFDLVVTGHNHLPFTIRYGEQLLVNPGSMMRMAADQVDHRPRVYLWYAEDNTVEPVYLPVERGVISRQHIEQQTRRNKRMEAFVERLDQQYNIDLNYEENIEKYFERHPTADGVKQLVMDALEG
uniref:Putative calcineurin-like phosphoesterase n=3 Tax=viral metagenome TaxID=1070528 RepID=A0A6M3IP65_9ZZZZ